MQLFWVVSCAQAEVTGFRQRARFISLPRVLLLPGGKGYSEGEPVVAHSETGATLPGFPSPGKRLKRDLSAPPREAEVWMCQTCPAPFNQEGLVTTCVAISVAL